MALTRRANVLLVGSGGIGTIAALNLERGGQANVTAVLRSNYSVVKESGFTIESVDHGTIAGFRPSKILDAIPDMSQAAPADVFDFVVCATKNTPDISRPNLVDLIRPAVTPVRSAILLIQNGLGIEAPFLRAFPQNAVLSGISMCGSAELTPGVIRHIRPDHLQVGAFPPLTVDGQPSLGQVSGSDQESSPAAVAAHDFVTRYAASGHTSVVYDADVPGSRWRKLVYNAAINPVCAVANIDTTQMRQCPDMLENLVKPAMRDIYAAAAAYGHVLPEELKDFMIEANGPLDGPPVYPSMLVDVRKNRYLEVENLLGAPAAAAAQQGVDTPVLNTLYQLCRGIQYRTRQLHDREGTT